MKLWSFLLNRDFRICWKCFR